MATGHAGQSASSRKVPLRLHPLLIVTRMGRDYRPGLRQRIEQVARQGSAPPLLPFNKQSDERLIDIVIIPSRFVFDEQSAIGQLLKILCGGRPGHAQL